MEKNQLYYGDNLAVLREAHQERIGRSDLSRSALQQPRPVSSYAPPGLGSVIRAFPRLAPWAAFFRRFAAAFAGRGRLPPDVVCCRWPWSAALVLTSAR